MMDNMHTDMLTEQCFLKVLIVIWYTSTVPSLVSAIRENRNLTQYELFCKSEVLVGNHNF